MAAPNKVVFSGPPAGGLGPVLKKVEAVHKKNGPFAALFCVGQLFGGEAKAAGTNGAVAPIPTHFVGSYGSESGTPEAVNALTLADRNLHHLGRAGVTEVAGLTVAFLDGTYNAAAYHGSTGPSGVGAPYYTEHDVQTLRSKLQSLEGEVDVLLTCEWPKGVLHGVPEALLPSGVPPTSAYGSEIAAEMAQLAKPRYHFAAGHDCFFARLPYANKDLGAGARATRFIALAPAGSAAKQKSLHALSLVPASSMDPEALSTLPEGCTPSPYDARRGGKRGPNEALPDGDSWRWAGKGMKKARGEAGGGGGGQVFHEPPAVIEGRTDILRDPYSTITARNVAFKANEADIVHFFGQAGKVVDVIRSANRDGKLNTWVSIQYSSPEEAGKALQLHNTELMGRSVTVEPATESSGRKQAPLGVPVEGCWFCLGSASVDLSLVASVGNEAYVALDKGAITDQHVLLVPVDHYPSSVCLSPPCYTEVERYLSSLRSCYASQGMELVGFERHLALRKSGGNHCHINVIGVPREAAKQAKQAFQQAAERAGFSLRVLPPAGPSGVGGSSAAAAASLPSSSQASLRTAAGDGEYFCALLPDGTRMLRPIMRGERWPMNLGREVLAQLAGVPERSDWKACSASTEEEQARTERFKAAFKPFDLMLQGGDA